MDWIMANFTAVMFYALAVLTVAGAVGVIAFRSPVHSAMSLLWTFLMVAALFVLREAEFLGAVQVFVYAGGILVLFVFVIMLVNVQRVLPQTAFLSRALPLAMVAGVVLGLLVALAILLGSFAPMGGDTVALRSVDGAELGNTEALGWTLYTRFLIPFEVVSLVLLVAMVGAIIFGRRDPALEQRPGRTTP